TLTPHPELGDDHDRRPSRRASLSSKVPRLLVPPTDLPISPVTYEYALSHGGLQPLVSPARDSATTNNPLVSFTC
ncbi:hypothetical protein KI387_002903, partial [Taxus chinensis]